MLLSIQATIYILKWSLLVKKEKYANMLPEFWKVIVRSWGDRFLAAKDFGLNWIFCLDQSASIVVEEACCCINNPWQAVKSPEPSTNMFPSTNSKTWMLDMYVSPETEKFKTVASTIRIWGDYVTVFAWSVQLIDQAEAHPLPLDRWPCIVST